MSFPQSDTARNLHHHKVLCWLALTAHVVRQVRINVLWLMPAHYIHLDSDKIHVWGGVRYRHTGFNVQPYYISIVTGQVSYRILSEFLGRNGDRSYGVVSWSQLMHDVCWSTKDKISQYVDPALGIKTLRLPSGGSGGCARCSKPLNFPKVSWTSNSLDLRAHFQMQDTVVITLR